MTLTLGCTFAAALFGFGSGVFSFRSIQEGTGLEQLMLLARLLVYLALAVLLVFKGGWQGVLAATLMVAGATAIEWALLPLALSWASIPDPAGYAGQFASFSRPSYGNWATWDIFGISIAAAFAQGLRLVANADRRGIEGGSGG